MSRWKGDETHCLVCGVAMRASYTKFDLCLAHKKRKCECCGKDFQVRISIDQRKCGYCIKQFRDRAKTYHVAA